MSALRRLKRGIAKVNMKKAGFRRICKKEGGESLFADIWRDYAMPAEVKQKRGKPVPG